MGINVDEYYANKSAWLKAEDLKDKEHKVIIADVRPVEFDNDDGKETKLGLSFVGREKGMILNKTNKDAIRHQFGSDSDNWIDREVIIYPTVTDFGGKTVPCIRVRVPLAVADESEEIPF